MKDVTMYFKQCGSFLCNKTVSQNVFPIMAFKAFMEVIANGFSLEFTVRECQVIWVGDNE